MGVSNCYLADGTNLNPRGFWGTMNTQGAANINGDAFQPFYDTPPGRRPSPARPPVPGQACYDATNYYNYAIEMQAGSSGGAVYVYDPNFCSVARRQGHRRPLVDQRRHRHLDLRALRHEEHPVRPVRRYAARPRRATCSRTCPGPTRAWAAPTAAATARTGPTPTYGDGRDYHNHWYQLATGLTGGASAPKVYRLHTTSTDPSNVNAQKTVERREQLRALRLGHAAARHGSTGSAPCRPSRR